MVGTCRCIDEVCGDHARLIGPTSAGVAAAAARVREARLFLQFSPPPIISALGEQICALRNQVTTPRVTPPWMKYFRRRRMPAEQPRVSPDGASPCDRDRKSSYQDGVDEPPMPP